MSYLNSVTIIGFVGADPEQHFWLRALSATSEEQQRFEVHRSFRRHAAVVEEHRRRMGVENRVASRLRVPPAARRIRRDDHQEGFARACRGHDRDKRGQTGQVPGRRVENGRKTPA